MISSESNTTFTQAELRESAARFLNELVGLQPKERLLVYLDDTNDQGLIEALKAEAAAFGGCVEPVMFEVGEDEGQQVAAIVNRIRQGGVNAMCELSAARYFYLTEAWAAAREARARIYSIAGLDAAGFVRCVGKVDHRLLFDFGQRIQRRIQRGRKLQIVSSGGAEVEMDLNLDRGLAWRVGAKIRRVARQTSKRVVPSLAKKWRNRVGAFIFEPSGFIGDNGESFLGGQLSFRGEPNTIKGTALIDGYLWPPTEVGLLKEPLRLEFSGGSLCGIGGEPEIIKMLNRRFEGQDVQLEHFCLGFNPGSRWSGKLLEVERIFGAITFGFGRKELHTDAVMRRPTIVVDGEAILRDGVFVGPELEGTQQALLGNEAGRLPTIN